MAGAANESAIKKALRLGGVLFAVTAVTGMILGVVQWGTSYAILQAELAARTEALKEVMPEASRFEDFEALPDDAVAGVQRAGNDAGLVGWFLSVNANGYGGVVNFVVGVTKDGVVKGIKILNHSETPGLGAKSAEPEFYGQFRDRAGLPLRVVKGAAGDEEISAISGATITSTAVTDGVNAAWGYWERNLKGK